MKKYAKYWKALEKIEDDFYGKVGALEKKMEKETGIKGIEFFNSDGAYVGIGSEDRTMKLVHRKYR